MRLTVLILSILPLVLGLIGLLIGPASRFGLIEPRTGISLLAILGVPVALATLGGLVAIGIATWRMPQMLGLAILGTLPALALTAALLMMKQAVDSNPFIHDITTDVENPPQIIAGADKVRDNPPAYDPDAPVPGAAEGQTLAEVQRAAFPDIQPITLPVAPAEAEKLTRDVMSAMGLAITDERRVNDAMVIEAIDRSLWFGFTDDVVVRLQALSETETRIDIRSQSRIGASDLGVNAKRVRELSQRLKAQHQGS